MKNVAVVLFFPLLFFCQGVSAQEHVVVDQVGYDVHAPKIGILVGSKDDRPTTFRLLDSDTGEDGFIRSLEAVGRGT